MKPFIRSVIGSEKLVPLNTARINKFTELVCANVHVAQAADVARLGQKGKNNGRTAAKVN